MGQAGVGVDPPPQAVHPIVTQPWRSIPTHGRTCGGMEGHANVCESHVLSGEQGVVGWLPCTKHMGKKTYKWKWKAKLQGKEGTKTRTRRSCEIAPHGNSGFEETTTRVACKDGERQPRRANLSSYDLKKRGFTCMVRQKRRCFVPTRLMALASVDVLAMEKNIHSIGGSLEQGNLLTLPPL